MELYTLDQNFLKTDVIDKFFSAIWTERYSSPGDIKLEVEATSETVSKYVEGTRISRSGTKEVMTVETQSIENNKLTIIGNSLLDFLDERVIYGTALTDVINKFWLVENKKPGELMAYIVGSIGVYNVNELIPNLTLGSYDISGVNITVAVPHGPVLATLKDIANTYSLGMSLYLDSATISGHSLKFTTYAGVDRSNSVIFSSSEGSLSNVKELSSIDGFKNTALGFPSDEQNIATGVEVSISTDAAFATGFDRRMMIVFVDKLTFESIGAVDPLNPTLAEMNKFVNILSQRTLNELYNNSFTRVIDGEVVPQNGFVYGTDYKLGDIVGLEGYSGVIQPARVTEYITAQDATGEREYPTVSIIEEKVLPPTD